MNININSQFTTTYLIAGILSLIFGLIIYWQAVAKK